MQDRTDEGQQVLTPEDGSKRTDPLEMTDHHKLEQERCSASVKIKNRRNLIRGFSGKIKILIRIGILAIHVARCREDKRYQQDAQKEPVYERTTSLHHV